ncbi:IS630 family transposase [Oceanobacillus jeddahense]|uniref:IS630 family transposase n=1 Tax=Oceanobacillus jeddahense TaxID=1462527 RepID=A0ABY5K0L3_9BACI|nr:IS630 family transposase [Oceanobacillus jeddahense]UUI05569.1 IS630 family transposase [Oceanobacillus jeddahense]
MEEMKEVMKNAIDSRHYERSQAVYLYLSGYKMKEIANIIHRCRETVGAYVAMYRNNSLEGLKLGHLPGKPSKLSKEQQAILLETVSTKVPADVGFTARYNWTLSLITQFVKNKWDISYSLRGMLRLLHSLGLSYTRPTYTLEKADPEKQKEFTDTTFPTLKKLVNEEIHHILFEDESMIRDYQAIQRTWFLKGKQRIIPTHGQHKGVKLVGTLNYETGEIFCIEEEKFDAAAFLKFLTATLEHYPIGKTVMILDNARIHHAKPLRPFLDENKGRLDLVYLPPYSPELNLIEGLWKWLKESVINNVFFPDVKKIALKFREFIGDIN